MKSKIIFLVIFITTGTIYAQVPPPRLILDFTDSEIQYVENNYELSVNLINQYSKELSDLEFCRRVKYENSYFVGNSFYTYLANSNEYPKKGSSLLISIENKKTHLVMQVIMRLCVDLSPQIDLIISDILFKEGIYFLDMCKSKGKYKVKENLGLCSDLMNTKENILIDTNIKLSNYLIKSISISKLISILKKNDCQNMK